MNDYQQAAHPPPKHIADLDDHLVHELWLDTIVPLSEGARLRSVSVITLKRQAKKGKLKLIRVSDRRLGIRRRTALEK